MPSPFAGAAEAAMFAFCSSTSPVVRSRQGIESLSLWRRRSLFLSPRRTQGAPSLSMASPIPSELLPALEALYAAPTGVSSPGSSSSDDAEQRRRAAERWLVAFQASDAAWQVRERVRSCCQRDGVFIISLFYASWKWLKRRGERRETARRKKSRRRVRWTRTDDERGAPSSFLSPFSNISPLRPPGLARPPLPLLLGPGARPRLRRADPALEVVRA